MADLTISMSVTRTELALADLDLNDGSIYRIAGHNLSLGRVQRRRDVAKSPFFHGGIEISSVKDKATITLAIDVFGSTFTQMVDRIDTLIDAFSQSEYTISATVDGKALAWSCDAADYESGLTTEGMVERQVTIAFECPRQPGTGVGS